MNSIFHRTSIRKFQKRDVEPQKVERILRAGMQAPSAMNDRPWEFYVVTNPQKIEELSHVSDYAGCVAGAPVVIVCVYRTQGANRPEYNHINMAIAQENIWLQAVELGLGGVWIGIAPFEDRMGNVAAVLDLPDTLKAFSVFPLGYPAEEHPQPDRFEEDRIHYMR